MKVVMLETGGWGGIAHYAWNLCQGLSAVGVDVLLLTHERYELDERPRRFAVERLYTTTRPYLALVRETRDAVARFAGDLVHLQSPLSPGKDRLLYRSVRTTGRPIVITAHNTLPHELRWHDRWAWRLLYRGADLVICHSAWSRRELCRVHGLDEGRCAVIPMGEFSFFEPGARLGRSAARARLGIPADDLVVLAFGTIRAYKGLQDLVRALPDVVRAVPRARLVIAGPGGHDQAEYARLITASGVAERIDFRPRYVPMEDVAAYFEAADVAAFAYRSIDQSASLHVALSLGNAVVVTAVGSFPETVEGGKGGIVVPVGDVPALARAIVALFSDPEARERMGRWNREHAVRTLGWEVVAAQTRAAYRGVLEPGVSDRTLVTGDR